jgi:hypothetical protein
MTWVGVRLWRILFCRDCAVWLLFIYTFYRAAIIFIKVVFSGFLLEGRVEKGWQSPHQRNCVYTTPLVWVESNETGFQSLNRRSRCSTRPSPFEVIASVTQNAFWGSGTARHLGPTPRGGLKFGRTLAYRTRTARNRRVKDARRSVTGPLSAAFARDMRVGDSGCGALKPRFLEMATYGVWLKISPDELFREGTQIMRGRTCHRPPPSR